MAYNSRRIRRESDTIKFGRVIVSLWIGTTVLTEATSDMTFHLNSRFGKRRDAGAIGFQTGSRFGRSDPTLAKLNQRLVLNPTKQHRIDTRFFVAGGRWGKRSDASPLKEALYSIIREGGDDEETQQFAPYAQIMRSDYEDPSRFQQERED